MVKSASAILISMAIELGLAGVAGYLALRFMTRRSDPILVFALFMVAITFGLIAIFSITLLGKSKSG
jgi:hypothetical protein